MVICKSKIDSKCRITLPKAFLNSNGINPEKEIWKVVIKNRYNCPNDVVLTFERAQNEDE